MNDRKVKNGIFILIITLYVLSYFLIVKNNFLRYGEFLTASFMMLMLFVSYMWYGFQKDKKNEIKKTIFFMTLSKVLFYFVIIYVIGIFTGFLKNGYSLKFMSIIKNIFAPLLFCLSIEFTRYICINANKDKMWFIRFLTFALFLLDIVFFVDFSNVRTFFDAFKVLTVFIIPIFIKDILLSYLTYKSGYRSSLLYRLVLDLYIYLLPIVPDLVPYIKSIVGIFIPFYTFLSVFDYLNQYNKCDEVEYKKTFTAFDFIMYGFVIILTVLISCSFHYFMIGIGSNSMNPVYYKGDAIIGEKVKEEELEVGDVIVFYKSGIRIVHRLDDIVEKDGIKQYYTKGDNNKNSDEGYIIYDDIIGVVKYRIPYIAYPTIVVTDWFEERDSKNE